MGSLQFGKEQEESEVTQYKDYMHSYNRIYSLLGSSDNTKANTGVGLYMA